MYEHKTLLYFMMEFFSLFDLTSLVVPQLFRDTTQLALSSLSGALHAPDWCELHMRLDIHCTVQVQLKIATAAKIALNTVHCMSGIQLTVTYTKHCSELQHFNRTATTSIR